MMANAPSFRRAFLTEVALRCPERLVKSCRALAIKPSLNGASSSLRVHAQKPTQHCRRSASLEPSSSVSWVLGQIASVLSPLSPPITITRDALSQIALHLTCGVTDCPDTYDTPRSDQWLSLAVLDRWACSAACRPISGSQKRLAA